MDLNNYLLSLYKFDEVENLIIEFAKKSKTPILSPLKGKILSFLVKLKNPKDCFEIGLGIGFSTYQILKSLSENSTLISIDKNFHRIDFFYENIYMKFPYKLRKKLKVFPLDCFYVMEIFKKMKKKFDFIFIDSQKRDYIKMIEYLKSILRKNGLCIVDNITYSKQILEIPTFRSLKYIEGIKLVDKFNKKISFSKDFLSCFIPVEDGMGLIIRL